MTTTTTKKKTENNGAMVKELARQGPAGLIIAYLILASQLNLWPANAKQDAVKPEDLKEYAKKVEVNAQIEANVHKIEEKIIRIEAGQMHTEKAVTENTKKVERLTDKIDGMRLEVIDLFKKLSGGNG